MLGGEIESTELKELEVVAEATQIAGLGQEAHRRLCRAIDFFEQALFANLTVDDGLSLFHKSFHREASNESQCGKNAQQLQ